MDVFDTIAAIATPYGEGGIAVIRVSGPGAFSIVETCFSSSSKKKGPFRDVPSHTIHHGYLCKETALIDEVLVSVFRSPRSYTGEDSVEISCHGGLIVARNVLETVLDAGARLADPGEFTRRAFLNGQLDLTQAEAIVDIIHARTERAARAASDQLTGGLSRAFDQIRDDLLRSLAHVEAYIDFPEEDISPDIAEGLQKRLLSAKETVQHLLATFREGQILRSGVGVAIVGRPNAGKSSLFNTLLNRERAIVSEIAGTTRDTIEADVDMEGVPMTFVDTAGLRDSDNIVEKEGVRRSREWITRADIILWVVDGSLPYSEEDQVFFKEIQDLAPLIIVLNKEDLGQQWNFTSGIGREDTVSLSCLTGRGLDRLKELVFEKAVGCQSSYNQGYAAINSRHRQGLLRCSSALDESLRLLALRQSEPIELLAAELSVAVNSIGELLGKTTTEDLLDSIFNQFCIGK